MRKHIVRCMRFGKGADYATRFLFDKYYVKCGNTSCAVCGLAKVLITHRSQMYGNESRSGISDITLTSKMINLPTMKTQIRLHFTQSVWRSAETHNLRNMNVAKAAVNPLSNLVEGLMIGFRILIIICIDWKVKMSISIVQQLADSSIRL